MPSTPRLTMPRRRTLATEQPGGFDPLWAAPASPYESMEGMLRGIEYARTQNIPFTGS